MGVVELHEYDEHLYILAGTFVDEQRVRPWHLHLEPNGIAAPSAHVGCVYVPRSGARASTLKQPRRPRRIQIRAQPPRSSLTRLRSNRAAVLLLSPMFVPVFRLFTTLDKRLVRPIGLSW